MVDSIAELSAAEGRAWSRLPYMSAEVRDSLRGWQIKIKYFTKFEIYFSIGKADFYGLNYYSSSYATPSTYERSGEPSFWTDVYTSGSHNETWPVAKSTWLVSVPEGLRGMLK